MADSNNDRLDLIQRLAEKQASDSGGTLAERAAEKLAGQATPDAPVKPGPAGDATVAPEKPAPPKPAAVKPAAAPQKPVETAQKSSGVHVLDMERMASAG